MSGGTAVQACGNCGAPLELDIDGRCRWCQARVQASKPDKREYAFAGSPDRLVPDDVDDCFTSSAFLYLALAALGPGLSSEPAVQQYIREQPVFAENVRSLAVAASEAGARIRDAGLMKNSYGANLHAYTPAEIWMFDLMIDVIAMLGALDGLSRSMRPQIASDIRQLDQEVASHLWKKALKKAGDGPQRYQELRAKVPHHTPSPARR